MRVRHDAKLTVSTLWPGDREPEIEEMSPEQLDGHLLVLGCLFNVSGYYNPIKPIVRILKIIGELKGDELCTCTKCILEPVNV